MEKKTGSENVINFRYEFFKFEINTSYSHHLYNHSHNPSPINHPRDPSPIILNIIQSFLNPNFYNGLFYIHIIYRSTQLYYFLSLTIAHIYSLFIFVNTFALPKSIIHFSLYVIVNSCRLSERQLTKCYIVRIGLAEKNNNKINCNADVLISKT